jgi:hypothetical protein
MDGKEIVAFRYDGEKYCRACFHQLPPKQIRFLPIPLALQRTSCVENCSKCGRNIIEDYNGQNKVRNQ